MGNSTLLSLLVPRVMIDTDGSHGITWIWPTSSITCPNHPRQNYDQRTQHDVGRILKFLRKLWKERKMVGPSITHLNPHINLVCIHHVKWKFAHAFLNTLAAVSEVGMRERRSTRAIKTPVRTRLLFVRGAEIMPVFFQCPFPPSRSKRNWLFSTAIAIGEAGYDVTSDCGSPRPHL